ncbi:MAG: type VI secretion system baseplate subunit TssE [Rhodobacteraceae bacterium]|nr:type VI secretion system baseplate subunit TssE [Paracoccaceae bacterium]
MSDQTIAERLQPSLLDRLTDDDPLSSTERREARVIDLRQLRDIIQRDLSWLLNTPNSSSHIDPDVFPHAAKSVLAYGIREVAGEFSTAERADLIRKSIQASIQVFEPRIHPGSIAIELRLDSEAQETVINFDIRADMWAQPMPIELYLRSQVDVTTGELELERVG